jgi:hypothetical protein
MLTAENDSEKKNGIWIVIDWMNIAVINYRITNDARYAGEIN